MQMRKHSMNEQQVLSFLIDTITQRLDDLYKNGSAATQFVCGEQTAYVECLEILQHLRSAERYGLDFDIEKKYPV